MNKKNRTIGKNIIAITMAGGLIISTSGCGKLRPKENITEEEREEAKSITHEPDEATRKVEAWKAEINENFRQGNYMVLEKIGEKIRKDKSILSNGDWAIASYYEALNLDSEEEDDAFRMTIAKHQRWRDECPESSIPLTSLANVLVSYAWKARGGGWANTVSPEMREAFQERLEASLVALKEAHKKGNEDIYWYEIALRTGLGQGWSREDFDKIINAAIALEPTYPGTYEGRAYSLLPRWYGTEGEWEEFAKVSTINNKENGAEIYARIIMDLDRFYKDIFKETKANYKQTKGGLISLMNKYPEATKFKNYAAYFATITRDREFAQENFEKIGDNINLSIWRKPIYFVHFRNWAKTGEW
jgi:hypothetical protein